MKQQKVFWGNTVVQNSVKIICSVGDRRDNVTGKKLALHAVDLAFMSDTVNGPLGIRDHRAQSKS